MEDSLLNAVRRSVIHYLNNLHGATPDIFVGVDPGATGAVAILIESRAFVADIPTLKVKKSDGKNKTEMNLPAVVAAVREFRDVRSRLKFAVEQAQAGGAGQGGGNLMTSFRVGTFFGSWLGILSAMGIPYARVQPSAWKRKMGLNGKDKESSRLLALELFPGADLTLKRHHDRAEALLIAEYHRIKLNGGS